METIAILSMLISMGGLACSAFIYSSKTNALPKSVLGISILSALSFIAYLFLGTTQTHLSFGYSIISLRFDVLNLIMYLMVSIIGLIVLTFSQSYLQGDAIQKRYTKNLLLTIFFVQLLMLSGSLVVFFLGWITTSSFLQRLMLSYKNRPEAQQAQRKKHLAARLSDITLLLAFSFIYLQFNSFDLQTIFEGLQQISTETHTLYIELAALFLVLTASIKSVQIPFHGWILEVMEAPTPVSALLHAGLLNAGPFLIIRFAYLLDASLYASTLLIIIGGISALYGTIVFPSQPSVKTSLAYSSIGHMGFSLMISGFGLYAAALLHLVAHSFYKAHSFLSSGSGIEKVRLKNLYGNLPFKRNPLHLIIGLIVVGIIFNSIAQIWGGWQHTSFSFMILCALIMVGISSYQSHSLGHQPALFTLFRSLFQVIFIIFSFFIFEKGIAFMVAAQIPLPAEMNIWSKSIALLILALFFAVVFTPYFTQGRPSTLVNQWNTYRRNGFYVHLYFDRFLQKINTKF